MGFEYFVALPVGGIPKNNSTWKLPASETPACPAESLTYLPDAFARHDLGDMTVNIDIAARSIAVLRLTGRCRLPRPSKPRRLSGSTRNPLHWPRSYTMPSTAFARFR